MDVKYTNLRIHFDGKYWYLSVGIKEEELQQQLYDFKMKIQYKCEKYGMEYMGADK